MQSSRYQICKANAESPHIPIGDRMRWKKAVEVYEHLKVCPFAHSVVEARKGKSFCKDYSNFARRQDV